ncbi:hypothetical protein SETIT_8G243200v2 [Setaria italica]|uniref:Serpin domain-containing protein n=1 Tax=Setaria italica TaxID=4555 RepID=K3ZIU0_SETIT|nr:serpin-Z1 [Setaria italica]RCV39680.1 hypothetical protein SETIT_8G243200v2 [Setaria italica]
MAAAFSLRVLSHIASNGGSRANLAVSPLSLHAALVLLGAGARGATLDQIVGFLGPAGAALASHAALHMLAADHSAGGPTVRFANGIWVDAALRLKDAYARAAVEHYRAEARPAPFKSMPEDVRLQINQWVASATAGRIKDLLPPGSIDSGTPAVLANALYFKGAWERKFDTSLTQDGAFYLLTGGHVRVPFMSSTSKQRIVSRPGYKVLRLPYARGRDHRAFSMYVYLPDAHDGLPGLLHKLSSDPAASLESSASLMAKVPVRALRVPRFTVSYKTKAAAMLQDLGLALPFDPIRADFGDMVESPPEPLFVSEVYHECFVEVNEEGTEAAAATAAVMACRCCARPPPPEDFVADHPFMFLIQEDFTGVVVFAGQVVDPSLSR